MIACLLLSYFPASLEQNARPSLRKQPLIITEPSQCNQVFAACRIAAQASIKPGMQLRQAQLLCPEACFIPANYSYYQTVLDQLLAVLANFTERIELGQAQQTMISWLDLGPLVKADLTKATKRLGQAVRNSIGVSSSLGLAGGKFPAQVAAMTTASNKALVVASGHEAAFLAPFSIEFLPLETETARRLKLLGIRTLGQLAALPAPAVLTQFGQEGRLLHQLAQGYDPRPVLPHQPQSLEQASHQFDDPVTNQVVLLTTLRSIADGLAYRLQNQGRLSREIQLTLVLENKTTLAKGWVFRQPTASSGRFSQILSDLLGQLELQSGVLGVTVTLKDLIAATGEQLDLFLPQIGQTDRLRQALQDLAARYGADCFYQVALLNQAERLPERRFRLWEIGSP
jgi:DNA polymerase-4